MCIRDRPVSTDGGVEVTQEQLLHTHDRGCRGHGNRLGTRAPSRTPEVAGASDRVERERKGLGHNDTLALEQGSDHPYLPAAGDLIQRGGALEEETVSTVEALSARVV